LLAAHAILEQSEYRRLIAGRYASFNSEAGIAFENGKLKLKDLYTLAVRNGEPQQRSGQQEMFENLISRYI
jgi:xylose isomerase